MASETTLRASRQSAEHLDSSAAGSARNDRSRRHVMEVGRMNGRFYPAAPRLSHPAAGTREQLQWVRLELKIGECP